MAAHHAVVDDAHHRGGRSGGGAVGEQYMRGLSGEDDYGQHHQEEQSVAKALAAGTAAVSLLLLSGLTLTGTVLALIVATPLLVIFSPVLVPACFTVALLTAGFVSSGGLGAAAVAVLAWMYRCLQQHHGEQSSSKKHNVKDDWAHHRLDQPRTTQ